MADQGTEGLLSPFLRKQRFKAAKPYLNGRILDVGCGSGALAELVDPAWYVGIEVDETSVNKAKQIYPHHFFQNSLPPVEEKFNTVVSLAVIEHVPDPAAFLSSLSQYLESSKARIIITTPHPSVDWIHDMGASIGLFSKHANEEHEDLLNEEKLRAVGLVAGLKLESYSRFLFGANQLAVFTL
jgi:2-polyprenyl-3-methyl-5-hydroxy-6-metoxy-1,4-benzoquinol methylase